MKSKEKKKVDNKRKKSKQNDDIMHLDVLEMLKSGSKISQNILTGSKDKRKIKEKEKEKSGELEIKKKKITKELEIEKEEPKPKKKSSEIKKSNIKIKKNKKIISDSSEDEDLIEEIKKENSKKTASKSKSKSKKKIKSEDENISMEEITEEILDFQKTNKKKKSLEKNKFDKLLSTTNKKTNRKSKSPINEITGPLSNETIVLTGEFSITRDKFTNLLKSFGAKVTGSVSSRTTILIHGDILEDGRNYKEGRKYKTAIEKEVNNIFNEEDFENYMRKLLKKPNWSILNNDNEKEEKINIGKVSSKKEKNIKNKKKESDIKNKEKSYILWTEKYTPKSLDEIIGNKTIISKIINWLDDWDDVILNGKTKKVITKFTKGQKPHFENINARACLITGDPGIGKTSSIRLISKLKGYQIFETNASLQRNKSIIQSNVGFLFNNTTIPFNTLEDINTKNLIIMDEIDGMSGNDDRGGISALIDIIKKTKIPIICIANDRQSQKLKSLVNYCYDLKFSKPDKRQISQRMLKICEKEGINCEMNALEYICESCGNDIRQCINFIEMYSKIHKSITFKDISHNMNSFNKDSSVMLSNFDAAVKLLNNSNSKKMSFRELLDLYFIDYDLIPLLIHENYLSAFKFDHKKDILDNLSFETDLISQSDIIDKRIRTNQNWNLLVDRGILGSVSSCFFTKGVVPFPKFPELMGKMSSMRKTKREIKELKKCFFGYNSHSIKNEIVPLVFTTIINNINETNEDNNLDNCIDIMKSFKLNMEMVKENLMDLAQENMQKEFNNIAPTAKSAFTRLYNKNFKTSIIRKKGSKKGKDTLEISNIKYDEDGNPINEGDNNNDNNDDDNESSIIDVKDVKSKKSKKNTKDKKITKEKNKGKSKGRKNKKSSKNSQSSSFIDDSEEYY